MIARRSLFKTFLALCTGVLPMPFRAAIANGPPPAPLAKQAAQRAIWKSYYSGTRVWGYVDKHSVQAGEPFSIMASTAPNTKTINGRIEILRIGYYTTGDRKLVWQNDDVEVPHAGEVQVTASAMGAAWPTVVDAIDTTGWSSGYYTIDFVDHSDGQRDLNVAFIVVINNDKSGDILLEISTNTYQAYNAWGGYSFYECDFVGTHAQMVSFDRPTPPLFFNYDYYLVLWLETLAAQHNLKVDYASNFDIHRDRDFADRYKLFISGSHNEYWSREEFEAVYRRIFDFGKNTMFLGANTAYWQVRYADVNGGDDEIKQGRQLICYKSINDPIRYRVGPKKAMQLITMRFRDEARCPETMLMGVAYQSYFNNAVVPPIEYPYFVVRTDMPFFEGTGYTKGESIGDLVGYEWDNTDPDDNGRRLWSVETSQIEPIDPTSIKVLFTGDPVDINGHQGKAEAVYFISRAGAKVFTAGSIRWAWGLGKPGFEQEKFKTFNRNLLMHFLE